MTPLPHTYWVNLHDRGGGFAELTADGVPPLTAAAPRSFDGPGNAWSPEELFLAAIEGCFLFTLHAVARPTGLEILDVRVEGDGVVDHNGGPMRFTGVDLRVTLVVAPGTDHAFARRILEKAERACLVAASVSTPIRVEAEIVDGVEHAIPQTACSTPSSSRSTS